MEQIWRGFCLTESVTLTCCPTAVGSSCCDVMQKTMYCTQQHGRQGRKGFFTLLVHEQIELKIFLALALYQGS